MKRVFLEKWRTLLVCGSVLWFVWIWPTPYQNLPSQKNKDGEKLQRRNRFTGTVQFYNTLRGGWEVWGTTSNQKTDPPGLSPEDLVQSDGKKLSFKNRYVRIHNPVVGDGFYFSTFNENGGKGRCLLFLERNGPYTGQYWDLRKPGSLKNEFLGDQREVALGADGDLFMAVSGSVDPAVRFYAAGRPGIFKLKIHGKFLSAGKEAKFSNGQYKIFASEQDLGEQSNWILSDSSKPLPGESSSREDRYPSKDLIAGPLNGDWAGRLPPQGGNLKLVLHAETYPGGIRATMDSPDQNAYGISITLITLENDTVFFRIDHLDVSFEGKLDGVSKKISGTFFQCRKVFNVEFVQLPAGKRDEVADSKKEKLQAILSRAQKGDADAQSELGHIYRGDYGDPQNLEESLKWFKAAAQQGNTVGENGFGWALENGLATERNPQEAVEWYHKAAAKDDVWALNRVGSCYLKGIGVEASRDEAKKYFQKALHVKTAGTRPVVKNSRNPFSVPDVANFDLKDVKKLSEGTSLSAGNQDPNAASWTKQLDSSEKKPSGQGWTGAWFSRWNGGSSGSDWTNGKAEIQEKDGRFYILYSDSTDTYLIEAQKDGNMLLGKYRDMEGSDQGPWVGRLVDSGRIDGQWSQGRWDFRR